MTEDDVERVARAMHDPNTIKRHWEPHDALARRPWNELTAADRSRFLSYARAAIAAMPQAGWQPIETAPKDRQIILSRIFGGIIHQIDVGGWEVSPGRDDPGGYDPPFADWTSNYGIEEPTHWMPLPEPPQEKK